MSRTKNDERESESQPETGLNFVLGFAAGLIVILILSPGIGFFLEGLGPHAATSQEILDRIYQECEGVPIKAHNLMFYSENKNASERWGAFTLFPEDFAAYLEGLKAQTDRYATGGECSTLVPPRPPGVFDVPVDLHEINAVGHWWLYNAANTTTYCTKDHHLWLCCDMDNHRVFFYRNRN